MEEVKVMGMQSILFRWLSIVLIGIRFKSSHPIEG